MLLHKKENRFGQLLVEMEKLPWDELSEAEYGAIGYYIGAQASSKNVVIDGMPQSLGFDDLKYLLSPQQVSGAVSLCHIVGLTPEAPTLEAAFGGRKPEAKIRVGRKEIEEAWAKLTTAQSSDVDVVVFGCPHYGLKEVEKLAQLLNGKKLSSHTQLWVATAEPIYTLASKSGYTKIIEEAGGKFITGCCAGPEVARLARASGIRVVATNSARAAHYISRIAYPVTGVLYGSVEECIGAALTGKWRDLR